MSDQIIILTIAVTLAFAFGMASGISLERERQRRRKAQKQIDGMLGDGQYHHIVTHGDKVYIDGRLQR